MQQDNILLTISYDGTNFYGWQKQKDYRTIQGSMEECLSIMLDKEVSVRGASRTDAGVHSLCQLVLLKEDCKIPIEKLPQVINANLDLKLDTRDIVVNDARYVDFDFHPQYNVYKKTYQYRIYNNEIINPMYRNYSQYVREPLDLCSMKEACKYFIGEHDFSAFSTKGGMSKTTIRTINELFIKKDDEFITIEVSGNGFLYNMVRIIAGTLIEVGLNKINPTSISEIVTSLDRRNAGRTAEACGLTLYKIYYNL